MKRRSQIMHVFWTSKPGKEGRVLRAESVNEGHRLDKCNSGLNLKA